MPRSTLKLTLAAMLGALLLATSPAQDSQGDGPYRTGLLRENAAQIRAFMDSHPRITGAGINWLGLERVNEVRAAQGRPVLDVVAVDRIGRELTRAVPGTASVQADAPGLLLAADLPVSVDNSTLKFFPPIRSQNPLGSCASFSTTYYQLSYMTAFQRNLDIRDAGDNTNKYSPKWSYNMLNEGTDGGTYFGENYELLENHGAATWAEFPYDTNFKAWCLSAPAWRNALGVRTDPVQYLRDVSEPAGLALLKELLTNGYIMVFGTYVSSWQVKAIQDDPSTSADDDAVGEAACYWVNGPEGSHGMTVVGYNDAVWTDVNGNGVIDAGEKGALRIANSWGSGWRDGGFTWLAYDALGYASSVAGGPSSPREPAFFNDLVFLLTVRDAYAPSMIAEFTVNHLKRDQLKHVLGISNTSATAPTTTWTPAALQEQGGAFAFDGTTTAVDGTFVLDYTDILVAGGGTLRYHLGMRDKTTGDPATLKAFRIIDLTTEPDTEVASSIVPKTADGGEQVYSWVDYTYAGPAYNHPPELTYPRISPESGTTADTFVFSVRYNDQDGDPPSVRNVYVDGVAHATTYSASDGRYRWTANGLDAGAHSYYFDFEDGEGGTARAPVAGSLVGPQVYAFNLSALAPSSAPVGGGAFTLAVTGTGFVSGSVVTWDGSDRSTTFVSATRLEASIPASDLVLGKAVPIVARAPGGGLSSRLDFSVENPIPALSSISPVRANGGGAAFTLTVTGSNFVSNSSVLWNGVARTTTFVDATGLQASIPATDLAAGGEFEVSVNNPSPAGGGSAGSRFTVSDFTLEAQPEGTTVPAGQSAVFTVQVSPRYGSFDSAVAFRATGLPRGCTASFSPATLTPGGAAATTTLTLATTARSGAGAATAARADGFLPPGAALLLSVAIFLAFGAARRPWSRNRALRPAAAFLLIAMLVLLSACGAGSGGGEQETGTPAGMYSITILGTSGGMEIQDSVSLTVN
jgi:hypothetical protein